MFYFSYGDGQDWPQALSTVALCDRMGINWHELQATPAFVVQEYIAVMAAEAMKADFERRKVAQPTQDLIAQELAAQRG